MAEVKNEGSDVKALFLKQEFVQKFCDSIYAHALPEGLKREEGWYGANVRGKVVRTFTPYGENFMFIYAEVAKGGVSGTYLVKSFTEGRPVCKLVVSGKNLAVEEKGDKTFEAQVSFLQWSSCKKPNLVGKPLEFYKEREMRDGTSVSAVGYLKEGFDLLIRCYVPGFLAPAVVPVVVRETLGNDYWKVGEELKTKDTKKLVESKFDKTPPKIRLVVGKVTCTTNTLKQLKAFFSSLGVALRTLEEITGGKGGEDEA